MLLLLFVGIAFFSCACRGEGFTLPISGSEPEYNPQKWNIKGIKKYNNCYSYLLDDPVKGLLGKPQPGMYGGIKTPLKYNDCDDFYRRIRADNPSVYLAKERERCRRGFYKGYLALDPKKDDYHFYRQDKSGIWSHKPGSKKVRQYDSKFNVIMVPREVEKKNSPYHYTKECGYMCIPANNVIATNSAIS